MSDASSMPVGLATPEFIHELLDRAVDVVTVVDADGRIVYVNRTATDVLGWSADELVGRAALSLVHPEDLGDATKALTMVLDDPDALSTVELRLEDSRGHFLWFDVLTSGWIDATQVRGLLLNLRETTGRHEVEALAARRAQLDRLVAEVSRQALDATLADVTDALPGMLAHLGALLGAGHAYVATVDRPGITREVATWTAAGTAPRRGRATVLPTDLDGLDGLDATEPLTDGQLTCPLVVQGRLLGVLVIEAARADHVWDHDEITAVRAVGEALAVAVALDEDQRALAASEMRFRLLAENASDVISLSGLDGRCKYLSPAASEVLGLDPDEMIGRSLLEAVHPDDRELLLARLAIVRDTDEPVVITCRWITPDDGVVWLENIVRVVRDADTGACTGYQSSARDVTARKALEDELSRLALHDALTGVANRALFVDRLSAALASRQRTGDPFAVLEIDLDGFKDVNDRFGHHTGDHALVTVAERLTAAVRKSDVVARVGGDEFTVLCLDSSAADALRMAERLVNAVGEPISRGDATVTVGASIGVAPADEGDPTLDALLRAADDAMYDAKRAGKGCVRLKRP